MNKNTNIFLGVIDSTNPKLRVTITSTKDIDFRKRKYEQDFKLQCPMGMAVNDDRQILYIVDHTLEIVQEWNIATEVTDYFSIREQTAGGRKQKVRPISLTVDKQSNSLLISREKSEQITKWCLEKRKPIGEIILHENIDSWGIALDHESNIYVCNSKNNAVHKYSADGSRLDDILRWQNGKDTGASHAVVAPDGTVYVTSYAGNSLIRFTADGKTEILEKIRDPERNTNHELHTPDGIAIDQQGILYVAEATTGRITYWQPNASEGTILESPWIHSTQKNYSICLAITRDNVLFASIGALGIIKQYTLEHHCDIPDPKSDKPKSSYWHW